MLTTSKAFRIALTAAALCGAAASTADAKPRRLVILDFDGPRGLADSGRDAVVALLGEQYDVVATKRWSDARAAAEQKTHGPQTWSKAAKSSGVDAVIEGWIQDEGRHHVLTVAVREASSGNEIDSVSIKLGQNGLSTSNKAKLATELDGVLEYIEGAPEPVGSNLRVIETRKMIGAKTPKSEETASRADSTDDGDDTTEARPRKKKHVAAADDTSTDDGDATETKPTKKKKHAAAADDASTDDGATETRSTKKKKASADAEIEIEPSAKDDEPAKKKDKDVAALDPSDTKDNQDLVSLFGAKSDEGLTIDPKVAHVPVATPRFRIGGGGYYASRTLSFEAENQTGPQNYAGVPHKGLEVNALIYPFPLKKVDGDLSGIGFSFNIAHSAGSVVTFDDGENVGEYTINQSSYDAGIHYRQPLGDLIAIDGHVNYGKNSYIIEDAPETFEVPDTSYSYLGAGVNVDLNIANRATVGFGAKYMYVLDVGDISSVDWYGPGRASGWGLNGNFVIPLPKQLYLQGALDYEHYSIEFDGVGQITEDEGVSTSSDSTVAGRLNVGIQF